MRCQRLWRQMKYQIWHGYAHEPNKTIPQGGLALFCAACPQPNINLPADWEKDVNQYVVCILRGTSR